MYASYESMYLWCTSVNCMIRPVGSYSWDSLIFRGQFVMANELHRKWPWDFRALWWFEVGGGGAVMTLTGSLDYLCSGGSDTCKFMIMFRDFPVHHAWFGLVIHHDPCNMLQKKPTFYDKHMAAKDLLLMEGTSGGGTFSRYLQGVIQLYIPDGFRISEPSTVSSDGPAMVVVEFAEPQSFHVLSEKTGSAICFFFGQKVHRKSPHVCRSIASNS